MNPVQRAVQCLIVQCTAGIHLCPITVFGILWNFGVSSAFGPAMLAPGLFTGCESWLI
jgi:hypothetical protein